MKKPSTLSNLHLENQAGQIVRSVFWDAEILFVIFNFHTKRVETVKDLKPLDDKEISYDVLRTLSREDFLTQKSFVIPRTHLKLVMQDEQSLSASMQVVKNVSLNEDEPEFFQNVFRRTAIGLACLLGFIYALHLVFPENLETPPEMHVVQIVERNEKKPEPPVVTPSEKKTSTPVAPKKVVTKAPQPTIAKRASRGQSAFLGALTKSTQQGGLKSNNAVNSAGIGRGGSAGSGGVQTALYNKGLFAAPLGLGGRAQGGGGYGTKGKGGGQSGYGKQSLVGSSGAYFEPVSSDALVQGGLDPNEIAAVIMRHEGEIRACYEKGLQNQPNLKGRLSMKFLIGARGQVTSSAVSNSSLHHPGVENCIQARLRSWPFPQPEGGVTVKVSYPFVLKRVSGT